MKRKTRFHEHLSRSLTKAVTFRLLILCSDVIIVLTFTHQYDVAIGVVLGTNIASTLLYFLHERLWNSVHWGKAKK